MKNPLCFGNRLDNDTAKREGFFNQEETVSNLQLRKALWLIQHQFPFVELADIQSIHDSLKENNEIDISAWTARDFADFCNDILSNLWN